MDEVTFIIKTFERFYCVKRLVRSILKYYPNAKILIADDSEISCKEYFERRYPNVKVYNLPKDSGLSYGRNYLVDRVDTNFFVLLDDDFVFDKKTDVEKGLILIKENNLDILGGYFRNYSIVEKPIDHLKVIIQNVIKWERPLNYIGKLQFDNKTRILYANYVNYEFPEYQETDITHNFFIAKTNVVKNINRWDNELKLHEHTAFFWCAKNKGLKVGFSSCLSVQHKPIKLKKYSGFRNRDFIQVFMNKYNIEKIIATYDGENETIHERKSLD